MKSICFSFIGLLSVIGALGLAGKPPAANLKKLAEFDLPGPPGGGFDYLALDTANHGLLSAHLSAGQTYVIDMRTNKVLATVTDTPGVEGIEYVPEVNKAYTSNSGELQLELDTENDFGHLPVGNFVQRLWSIRAAYAWSPNLVLSSFVQYDTGSQNAGTNTRLRWTIKPGNDLFFVFNQGWIQEAPGGFHFRAQESKVSTKFFQYTIRF